MNIYDEYEQNFKLVEYKAFIEYENEKEPNGSIFLDSIGTLKENLDGNDIDVNGKIDDFRKNTSDYQVKLKSEAQKFAKSKVKKNAETLLRSTDWIFSTEINISLVNDDESLDSILSKKNNIRDFLNNDNIDMILDFENTLGHTKDLGGDGQELKRGQIYYFDDTNIILYEDIFNDNYIVTEDEISSTLNGYNIKGYANADAIKASRNPNTAETSDDRIKFNEKIINGTDAINTIKKINPYVYEKVYNFSNSEVEKLPTQEEWENVKDEWKYKISEGFIAQEIENIPEIKDCVNTRHDGIKTVKYDSVFVHLTSCVKELINKVEALEKEIALLKNN